MSDFPMGQENQKAMKKHKFGAGVPLDCDVVEPKNGRTRYKVVGVTERK